MFASVGFRPAVSSGSAATNPFEGSKAKKSLDSIESTQVQNSQTTETKNSKQASQLNESKESGKGQKPSGSSSSGPPAALLSVLNSLGLSPAGSKEADYANVMSHLASLEQDAGKDISQKQHISSMRQTFLAVYNSL